MTLRKLLNFELVDESHVSYGKRIREVSHTHGTTAQNFVKNYDELVKNHGLSITEDFLQRFYDETYKEKSYEEKLNMPFPYIDHLVGFILDANYLLQKHIDIKELINQFNKCKNGNDITHVFSLSTLAAIYAFVGYELKFPKTLKNKKTPDLTINKISSDVKVIHSLIDGKIKQDQIKKSPSDLREDLCYDIGKAIENRLCGGIEQADQVFINLNQKSLPFLFLGLAQKDWRKNQYLIPEPKKFRVIFYLVMKLANNLNNRSEKVPYSFYGTYIDVDPLLWTFVRQSDTRLVRAIENGLYVIKPV